MFLSNRVPRVYRNAAGFLFAGILAIVLAPSAAAQGLPLLGKGLPLDRSVEVRLDSEPLFTTVHVPRPGYLVLETQVIEAQASGADVFLLDDGPVPVGLPVRGRASYRVDVPGTFNVALTSTLAGTVRVHGWLGELPVDDEAPDAPFTKDDPPPEEPMDEWDEVESRAGGQGVSRREALEAELRLNASCPWSERPELLETWTCARSVGAVLVLDLP